MFIEIFIFLLGLAVGSFLNVCIHRMPQGESVVWPRSYCPNCRRTITWFDNIPILSFLILRGRCRHCRGRISFRYPLVELLSGLIWYWNWQGTEGSLIFWIRMLFLSSLLIVTVTDFETGLIPDTITFVGIVAGTVLSFLYPNLQVSLTSGDVSAPVVALGKSLAGLLTGGGLIYLTGVFGNLVFRKESMGGGDVKLLAMIGSFVGWEKVILAFFTAPIFALPFALYVKWIRKEEVIPYGPFLSVAGAVQFFYGDALWRYLLNL